MYKYEYKTYIVFSQEFAIAYQANIVLLAALDMTAQISTISGIQYLQTFLIYGWEHSGNGLNKKLAL